MHTASTLAPGFYRLAGVPVALVVLDEGQAWYVPEGACHLSVMDRAHFAAAINPGEEVPPEPEVPAAT
jgi:hypothetical protein